MLIQSSSARWLEAPMYIRGSEELKCESCQSFFGEADQYCRVCGHRFGESEKEALIHEQQQQRYRAMVVGVLFFVLAVVLFVQLYGWAK